MAKHIVWHNQCTATGKSWTTWLNWLYESFQKRWCSAKDWTVITKLLTIKLQWKYLPKCASVLQKDKFELQSHVWFKSIASNAMWQFRNGNYSETLLSCPRYAAKLDRRHAWDWNGYPAFTLQSRHLSLSISPLSQWVYSYVKWSRFFAIARRVMRRSPTRMTAWSKSNTALLWYRWIF